MDTTINREITIRQTWRAVHDKVCLPVRVVE